MQVGTVPVEGGMAEGAEFVPLDGPPSLAATADTTTTEVRPQRVLVIEDNVDAADSLREVLEMWRHTVVVAYSGSDGIAKARSFRPEVVFCDIGLPEMDGYQVAQAMRSDPGLRKAKLVALTGYASPDDVVRSREAGFSAHFAKPPNLEAIEGVLATASGVP